jgi:predicted alpha/beta hydrolase
LLVGRDQTVVIGVEIGVIVLDAGEHECMRSVVEKLRTPVEIGGIVFVTLDDEALTPAGVEALAQIDRNTTDQIARIGPALGIDPGGQ